MGGKIYRFGQCACEKLKKAYLCQIQYFTFDMWGIEGICLGVDLLPWCEMWNMISMVTNFSLSGGLGRSLHIFIYDMG